MITLITGAPGSGKTLYCVDKIIQPIHGTAVKGKDEEGNEVEYPREIFTNINGLVIPHQKIDAEWLTKLPENKQTGALVVFDEVQRVWPNRPTGSKKPAAVEYLETHRHDGIDVVLLTQNPQLLDPAVRALVGRHLHMRRLGIGGGAVVYEWDACSNALNFKSAFTKKGYRYSKRVFDLYQSAKIHTKQKRALPGAVWGILLGLAGMAYFWPKFYGSMEQRVSSTPAQPSPQIEASGTGLKVDGSGFGGQVGGMANKPMTAEEYRDSFKPRHASLPHTAPRYDQVTQPTRAPLPAACIESKTKGCACWSQDATRLNVPHAQCVAIVANGFFVDFAIPGAGNAQVVSANAVHWEANGDPRASVGSQPVAAHVPDDVLTAGEIARLSRATTGNNIWARDAAPVSGSQGSPGARS